MVQTEPSRIARALQFFAALGLFCFLVGECGQVSASCGDYLAGSHTSHDDAMATSNPVPMPPSGKCSCKSGQCEASLPIPQQIPTLTVKFRDVYGVEDVADDGRSGGANQWRRPMNSIAPRAPFYLVLSPPPELA